MRTFRRLNDPERYYGLSWRGWLGCAVGGGVLYLAIRVSPLGVKPTISVTVIVLAFAGTALYGLAGQALGPGRFLAAGVRHAVSPKQLVCPDRPDARGLVLDALPLENDTAEIDPDRGLEATP